MVNKVKVEFLEVIQNQDYTTEFSFFVDNVPVGEIVGTMGLYFAQTQKYCTKRGLNYTFHYRIVKGGEDIDERI